MELQNEPILRESNLEVTIIKCTIISNYGNTRFQNISTLIDRYDLILKYCIPYCGKILSGT